jgi:hypothetical protein
VVALQQILLEYMELINLNQGEIPGFLIFLKFYDIIYIQ